MNVGVANWNSRNGSPVRFTVVASSNNRVTAGEQRWDYFGRIMSIPVGAPLLRDRFRIDLNSCAIIDSARRNGVDVNEFITSVMAHELGHAVGLADNPTHDINTSLMNHGRTRTGVNGVRGPTNFDIASVNMIYD